MKNQLSETSIDQPDRPLLPLAGPAHPGVREERGKRGAAGPVWAQLGRPPVFFSSFLFLFQKTVFVITFDLELQTESNQF